MLKKQTVITQIGGIQGIPKFAAKIEHLAPLNPDFRYIRFRAIGNLEVDGPNQNWDAFPYAELADSRPNYGWKTFVGKRAHVEHNSYSVENAIGELLDAYLNEFVFPEKYATKKWSDLESKARLEIISLANQNDGSVEVLMAVDTKLAPKIARMIDSGMKLACSMGTNIEYSDCSVCGNRAAVEQDYCSHVARSKGQLLVLGCEDIRKLIKEGKLREEWLPYVLPRQYDRESVLGNHCRTVLARVFEVNYGLNFFELSVVGNPAYPRANMLERVASKKEEIIEDKLETIKQFYGIPLHRFFDKVSEKENKISAFYSGQKHDCHCGGSCCQTKVAAGLNLIHGIRNTIVNWFDDERTIHYLVEYLPEIAEEFITMGYDAEDLERGQDDIPLQKLKRLVNKHLMPGMKKASLADLPRQDPEQKDALVQKFMGLAQDATQRKVLQEVVRNSKLFITPEGELGHVEDRTEEYPGPEVRFI